MYYRLLKCDDNCSKNENLRKSAAWFSGSERRFYDGHDRKVYGSYHPNLGFAS